MRFWLAVVPVLLLCAASITAPSYDYKTTADAGIRMWSPSGYSFVSGDASVTFPPGGPISCSSGSCVSGTSVASLPVTKITGWPTCNTAAVLTSPDGGVPVCAVPPEPKVANTTNGKWCLGSGTQVDCATNSPIPAACTSSQIVTSNGTVLSCAASGFPATVSNGCSIKWHGDAGLFVCE